VDTEARKVLGICGSPRRGGNTQILVEETLRGAAEAGALTKQVLLTDLRIGPCRACDACLKTGECVQHDDMPALLEKMRENDIWVLGTPVYWWGPTAQFKTFVDRWYCQGQRERLEGRRVIAVIPLGDTDAGVARHTVGMLQDSLDYLRAELIATVLAPGCEAAGAVREQPAVLAAARQAGREAVDGVE